MSTRSIKKGRAARRNNADVISAYLDWVDAGKPPEQGDFLWLRSGKRIQRQTPPDGDATQLNQNIQGENQP